MVFGRISDIFTSRKASEENQEDISSDDQYQRDMHQTPDEGFVSEQELQTSTVYEEPQQPAVDYGQLLAGADIGFNVSLEDASEAPKEAEPLGSVDDLRQPVKEEAIRIAKNILDNLRIQFAEMTLEAVMSAGDIPAINTLMNGVSEVTNTFKHHFNNASKIDPDLVDDPLVQQAMESMAIFNHYGLTQSLKQLEMEALIAQQQGDMQQASQLRDEADRKKHELEAMIAISANAGKITITELLNNIEQGMDIIVDRMKQATQQNDFGLMPRKGEQKLQKKQALEHEAQEYKETSQLQLEENNNKKAEKKQEAKARRSEENMQKFIRSDAAYDAMRLARLERRRKEAAAQKEEREQRRSARKKKGDTSRIGQRKKDLQDSDMHQARKPDNASGGGEFGNLLDAASFDIPDIDLSGMEENLDVMPNDPKRMVQNLLKGEKAKHAAIRSDIIADKRNAAEHNVDEIQKSQEVAAMQRKGSQLSR